MPGARFFPEAKLNFAENLLRRRDNHPALVFRGEDGRRENRYKNQLYSIVAQQSPPGTLYPTEANLQQMENRAVKRGGSGPVKGHSKGD